MVEKVLIISGIKLQDKLIIIIRYAEVFRTLLYSKLSLAANIITIFNVFHHNQHTVVVIYLSVILC